MKAPSGDNRGRAAASLGVALAFAAACSALATDRSAPHPAEAPLPGALLPRAPGARGPAAMEIVGATPERGLGAMLADVDACAECHADVVEQFRTSAHAFASFDNTIYRASVDRLRAEIGPEKSRFCGGCHDVALVADGALDREVEPTDSRARAGVTCLTCHGVIEARPDGNASYTLTSAPVPLPKPGDPESVRQHVARVAPAPLRTAALCGSCHRVLLGPATGNAQSLAGQDDLMPWMRSAHAGSRAERVDDPLPERDCRGCHMPREDVRLGDRAAKGGRVASHRFLGGHTWLGAMRGDADAVRRTQALLATAATLDVAAIVHPDGTRSLPADGAPIAPGERIAVEVAVRNVGTGHRLPGGTLDAQDMWIEISVLDAQGRLVAEAGADQAATGEDPTAHRLRALLVDGDGRPVLEREVNHFRTAAFDQTLGPRDVAVVGYSLEVPTDLPSDAMPLHVEALLRHRTRSLPVQRAACEASRTPRGRAFAAAAPGAALDVCAPQPITLLARAEAWIGPGASARGAPSEREPWRRLYEHGLGMSRALQERLDEARPSLTGALAALEASGAPPRERAMVLQSLGHVAARQGRVDEALEWIDRAQALLPDDPALDRERGFALAQVWRWKDSAPALTRAADRAPLDVGLWADLAIARASGGDERGALEAAQRGLPLRPFDPELLRAQALALGAMGAPTSADALEASLELRVADDAPALKGKCSARVLGCSLEREPVHTHTLRIHARSPTKTR